MKFFSHDETVFTKTFLAKPTELYQVALIPD